jgi:hypothetical protein
VSKLALFAGSCRLADEPLEARAADAAAVLEAEPGLDVAERRDLLLLVVAPELLAEVER